MADKHEAMLWEALDGQRVRCKLCGHGCVISAGKYGMCSVRENIAGSLKTLNYDALVAIQESQGSMLNRLFKIREEENEKRALELLEFLRISHVKDEFAKNLSYGQQKLLDFGMVLMSNPKLILLDEPTCGVEIEMRQEMMHSIRELNKQGHTIIVIEHNMDVIKTADYIIDLGPEGGERGGYVVAAGTPEEILREKNSYTGQFLKKYL